MLVEERTNRNYLINKPNFAPIYFLLSLISNVGSYYIILLSVDFDINRAIDILAIVCLIQFITSIFYFYSIEKTLLTLTSIFFTTSNIFHLGQLYLVSIDIKVESINYAIYMIDNQSFLRSCGYIFLCHSFYVFGVLLFAMFDNKKKIVTDNEQNEYNSLLILKKVGWILFGIGIIPKLYIDINKLILFLKGVYINTYEFLVSGYISLIASLSEYGILILLIAYQKNKYLCNIIFISGVLYQSIIIYSGNRGKAIIFITVLVFIYIKLIRKMSLKSTLVAVLVGYVGLITINVVGDTRSLMNRDWATIMTYIEKNIGFYPVYRILAEFGGSITSVIYSIEYFPAYASIQYGINYLVSFLLIFPNLGNALNLVFNKIQYVKNFPESVNSFLGGSYIGETYYSFNVIGPLFVIFIGAGIYMISKRTTRNITEKNWIGLSFTLVWMINLLWWNRDYFGSMIREIVWVNMLIFILIHYFRKNKK